MLTIYGQYIEEAFFNGKMKQVNKDLLDKIDDKYPWYFINLMELKGTMKSDTKITLYGFDEEPKHSKGEGILSGPSNQKIVHQLYEKTISGYHSKDDLDASLKRYAKYNTGAAYKETITEACKDKAAARQFVTDVKNIAKKYDANFFMVTDGASGYSNGNGYSNDAVKNARQAQIEWEKNNKFDPDEDWSK